MSIARTCLPFETKQEFDEFVSTRKQFSFKKDKDENPKEFPAIGVVSFYNPGDLDRLYDFYWFYEEDVIEVPE